MMDGLSFKKTPASKVLSIKSLTISEIRDHTAKRTPEITGGCILLSSVHLTTSMVLMSLEISRKKISNVSDKRAIAKHIHQLNSLQEQIADAAQDDLRIFKHFRKVQKKKVENEARYLDALKMATQSPLSAAGIIREIYKSAHSCLPLCAALVAEDLKASLLMLEACQRGMLLLARQNIDELPTVHQSDFQCLYEREAKVKFMPICALDDNMKSEF